MSIVSSQGTEFSQTPTSSLLIKDIGNVSEEARQKAMSARTEARKLQSLPYLMRKHVLYAIANALADQQEFLLAENAKDVDAAEKDGISAILRNRLQLSPNKIQTLASGIKQVADMTDPLGVVKTKRDLADGLELSMITVPIGVLLVIFESRPDSMPQIASLAIASGNGLLLKGGKEALHSNAAIHKVIGDAIERGSGGQIGREIIALITTRSGVSVWSLPCFRL